MSTSWRSCIIRIGERCPEYGGQTDPEEHLDTCYNAIVRDLRDSEHDILDVLLQCIMELPHKGPLYGALIGLLNLEDSAFVEKAIKQIHDELQDALDTDNCNKIRILIRFLSVLIGSNVITPSTVVEVFETLLSSAATTVDDDGGNPAWQPRADFYILCILASLPWCGLELFEHAHEELERVLAAVEAYMSLRNRSVKTSLHPFVVNVEGDGADQDYLDGLWSKTKELADSGWKLESVPRPYLVIEARLATGQNHDFGSLVCPPPPKPCPAFGDHILFGKQWQEAEAKYPHRIGRLRIFPSSKFDEKMTPMDAFVVEEYLLDVLFYLNGCRKECAAYMVGLPVPFRYEYLMAEVIFSQLLLLPKPPFKLIYYTIVMIDLCKALPGAFPGVVAGAVRNLFNRVGEMDVECQDRLIQWISHHLSNFQFVWPWEEWAHVLDQPKWSPQRVFAQEVLEREVRLSYWDKIKQSLQSTPKLVELLPPKNVPNFRFANKVEGLEAAYLLSGDLISMVKAKKSIRDMQLWLQAQVLPSHDQKTAIDILVQTLLHVGSKSFTHMVTVMERYGQLISKIAPDQSSQVTVIETVASFWQNSVQMTAIVIDRMMGYRLVSNLAIVKWVFSAVNVQTFHTSNKVWEVLRNAISKTVNRTLDLRKDITKAKVVLGEAHATLERAQTHLLSLQAMETEDPRSLKMERAKSQFERAKDAESTARDGYETKEVLLDRALREQEELFICVIKNFVAVITGDLSNSVFTEDLNDALPGDDDFMEVDLEKPSHEADDSNVETDERRNLKYDRSRNGHKGRSREEERAQWRCCTLGHLQSLSRQYAAELWLIMQRLDAEILNSNVDPCILKAVYSGLHRKE